MSAHALLIGVTRFSDPQLNGLRAPRSDVEALKAVLADPARGGFDEVVPSIDEDLLAIRDKVSGLLEDRHPDDMVLLYYSGHGIVDRSNSLFLATGETRAEKPRARSLPSSEVREMMEQSRAGRVVVVLDCCHSGVFTEGAKGLAAPVNDRTFDLGEGAEGVYILTATNAIQYALDSGAATGDAAATTPTLSHFTSWLLDGLGRGEAAPHKPVITLDDLYAYLCRRARQSGAPMTPQRYVKRNSGEMIIARNPAVQPLSIPDSLLSRLERRADRKARLDADAELKDVVSKRAKLQSAERKSLRDRVSSERDHDFDAVVERLSELDDKHEPDKRWRRAPLTSVLQHIKRAASGIALGVKKGGERNFERRLFRGASWILISACIVAAPLFIYTMLERSKAITQVSHTPPSDKPVGSDGQATSAAASGTSLPRQPIASAGTAAPPASAPRIREKTTPTNDQTAKDIKGSDGESDLTTLKFPIPPHRLFSVEYPEQRAPGSGDKKCNIPKEDLLLAPNRIYFGMQYHKIDDSFLPDLSKSKKRDAAIKETADWIAQFGRHVCFIVVIGAVDIQGTSEYELALAQGIAESVRRALENDGINGDLIEAISFGKETASTALAMTAKRTLEKDFNNFADVGISLSADPYYFRPKTPK